MVLEEGWLAGSDFKIHTLTVTPNIYTYTHYTVLSYLTDGGKKMRPVDWVVHWWSHVTMRFIGYNPKVRKEGFLSALLC